MGGGPLHPSTGWWFDVRVYIGVITSGFIGLPWDFPWVAMNNTGLTYGLYRVFIARCPLDMLILPVIAEDVFGVVATLGMLG